MKVFNLLIFGLVVGIVTCQNSPTTLGAADVTTIVPTGGNGGATGVTDSGVTSNTDSTGGGPGTGPTYSPTDASFDRHVQFKVDCTKTTQCDFTFKIAEQLMRYVNTTHLESILGDLAGKIQQLSTDMSTLSSDETSYQAYLSNSINQVQDKFTALNENVTSFLDTVTELNDTASNDYDTITKYLNAARCFQNDLLPSVECGALAGIGVTPTTSQPVTFTTGSGGDSSTTESGGSNTSPASGNPPTATTEASGPNPTGGQNPQTTEANPSNPTAATTTQVVESTTTESNGPQTSPSQTETSSSTS